MPEPAGVLEDHRAVPIEVHVELDSVRLLGEEPASALAVDQRLLARVLAVDLKEVEGNEGDLSVVFPRVDLGEVRDGREDLDDAFAVEQDGFHLQPADGFDDARETGPEVGPAAGVDAHMSSSRRTMSR